MSDTVVRPSRASQKLGRYELIELLAQGGMGEVHLARIAGTGGFEKLCIVKTILPALLKDSQFVERFQHEAKVLVHLSHANIAQVYDMGESDGVTYIALEFVPGVDLASLHEGLRKRGEEMPVPAALYVGQKLADGLGYAHRKLGPDGKPLRIVHRDVSPQNVMLSFEGDLKIIDFGLAKSTARARQTQTPTVMGKLGYMSPEQARAEVVDGRSDIYSAGVVVWELLAGRQLVPRGTASEMVAAMMSPHVPPLAPLRPALPAGLEQAVLRALAPKPVDRYATADEFSRALTEISLRTTGLLATERMGEFVRTTCPEPFESHRRLISRLNTLRSSEPPLVTPLAQTQVPLPAKRKSGVSAWVVTLGVLGFCLACCLVLGALGKVLATHPTPVPLQGVAADAGPPRKYPGRFTAHYGTASTPLGAQMLQLAKGKKMMEGIANGLNSGLGLPRDISLSLEGCGKANAFYNPVERRVHLCTELMAYFIQLFTKGHPAANPANAAAAAITFALLHETGHALIHVLDLSVLGREEDAADELATLLMALSSPEGQESGLYAAIALMSFDTATDARKLPFWDEHSLGRVRFFDVICWLYGANPKKFQPIVQNVLPHERAKGCVEEFAKLNSNWHRQLEPYLAAPWPKLSQE